MLLIAYDTNASGNGIKVLQRLVVPHLNFIDLRSATLPLTTVSASHDVRAGGKSVI